MITMFVEAGSRKLLHLAEGALSLLPSEGDRLVLRRPGREPGEIDTKFYRVAEKHQWEISIDKSQWEVTILLQEMT